MFDFVEFYDEFILMMIQFDWIFHSGEAEIADMLIKHGANVNARDFVYKETPLHKAVYGGDYKLQSFYVYPYEICTFNSTAICEMKLMEMWYKY